MGSYEEAKGYAEIYGRYFDSISRKVTQELNEIFTPAFFGEMESYNFVKKESGLSDEEMAPHWKKVWESALKNEEARDEN